MKHRVILTLIVAWIACGAWTQGFAATQLKDETLNYKVTFKWGLIQKQAGRATMTLRNTGSTMEAVLYARSEPWADKIYSLRDTLKSTMNRVDVSPIKYERIAHEDGKFSHDIVEFNHKGNIVTGKCTRYRKREKEENLRVATTELSATGMTVDMLSAFYYLRSLDFKNMKPGDSVTVNIFSGKRKERLTIRYENDESLKLDGRSYPTHHVTFMFTTDDNKKSSEGIDAWIWTEGNKIPLKLEGHLKVGKIRCLYVPN